MITIEYSKEKRSRTIQYSLSAEGHAGYAPEGQDIICAAVSTLFCTLANALSDSGASELDVCLEPGNSGICCEAAYSDFEIEAMFRFAMIGLEMLEEQYPDYVEILEE